MSSETEKPKSKGGGAAAHDAGHGGGGHGGGGHGGGSLWLISFADLLSCLFGFFVLMFAMSEIDPRKVEIAYQSIAAQFQQQAQTSDDSRDKQQITGKEQQQKVAAAFIDAFPVVRVERIEKGNILRVRVAADTIFVPGAATVRTDKTSFMERLAEAVSQKEEGRRAELEILLGSGPTLPVLKADGQTPLELRRVGALARDMRQRGVPAEALSAGLQPGDTGQLEFRFFIRLEARSRVTFEQLSD